MAADGIIPSENAFGRIAETVRAYENTPRNSPPRRPPHFPAPRPPIRVVLLENLDAAETAQAAVCQFVEDNAVQRIAMRGVPVAGTFTLAFGDETSGVSGVSGPIEWDARAADLKKAIVDAIDGIENDDIKVYDFTATTSTGLWYVEFTGKFAGRTDLSPLSLASEELTGVATVEIGKTTWRDSGRRETVREMIGVGSPTPLVAGAAGIAVWFHRAGYGLTSVEARDYDWLGTQ